MHAPLRVQDAAHLCDASPPAPPRTTSIMPVITSTGLASAMPAGSTLGHASTHLPHLIQASSICSTRPLSAASNVISSMGHTLLPEVGLKLTVPPLDCHCFRATLRSR